VNLKILNRVGPALSYRSPSFVTFSTSLDPIYSFGIPRQVKMSGIMVDMDAVVNSLWAKNNDANLTKTLGPQIGMMTSALEHRVPELFFTNEQNPGEAVSAVKALALASAQGQRIYRVTAANVNSVLPVLNISSEVKEEIRDSVAVGKTATVSQNNVTVGHWTGVGYIVSDPQTGSGAYRISGGSNGGSLTFTANSEGIIGLLVFTGLGMLTPIAKDLFPFKGDCGEEDIVKELVLATLLVALIIILAILVSQQPWLAPVLTMLMTMLAEGVFAENSEDNCCPENAPYGAYYRYEVEEKWFIQALATNFLWGNTPRGGLYPTVQAYRKDHSPYQPYRYGFCTEVKPAYSGVPIVQWYGEGHTPGVIMENGVAKIPIVIITSGPKL